MSGDVKTEGLLTPQQLHKMAEDKAMAEARLAFEQAKKVEEQKREMRASFLTRELRPDVMERVMTAVKQAAERGGHEILVLQFPASLLTDGGRRVNNFEPDWPESLDGFPKRAFELYQKHLQPVGYKLRAQILDYPGGMPGEVGLYLSW